MMIGRKSGLRARFGAIFCTECRSLGTAILLGISLLGLSGCASLVRPNFETEIVKLRPGNYVLDPDHAFVLFRIDHLGLSQVIGRFNEIEANLNFDPDNIADLQLDGRIATSSIDLNNPTFESQLRGRDWLDSERFPDARFETTAVSQGPDGALSIVGDLTLRGVTLPITLAGRFNGGADNILTGKYTLGFSATTSLSRKAYGIDDYGPLVGDTIDVEIQAEFQKQ